MVLLSNKLLIHATFVSNKEKVKMVKLFFIPVLIVLSCGSTKTNQSAVAEQKTKDSLIVSSNTQADNIALPTCIKHKIDSFKVAQKHEQPQKVVEYLYKGKKVYYVVMPCCDFFNEVYDDKCKLLGSPDGGFTGKGDGKLPDFFKEAKNEKVLWEAQK